MTMMRWVTELNPWLPVGAGLYWASYAFRIMNAAPAYALGFGANAPVLEDVFMTLWVVATYVACRRWGLHRSRVRLSRAMVVIGALVLVSDVLRPALPTAPALALMALDFFTLGASMILWGMCFASLEKHLSAVHVVVAVLNACLLILLGLAVTPAVPASWLTDACTIASAAVMASGRISLRNIPRQPRTWERAQVAWLLAQRLLYGFSLGFFPAAIGAFALSGPSASVLAYAVVLLACGILFASALRVTTYAPLPSLFLVAIVCLCLPFTPGGFSSMMLPLLSGIWLSWQTLSSVQLSDLKERLGMSELDLSLADKFAIAVTILTGAGTCRLLDALGVPKILDPVVVQPQLLMVTTTLALLAACILSQLIGEHQQTAIRDELTQAASDREERVFDDLAREYALSPRERQIVGLIARGYTCAFVSAEVGIAEGTVKAHVAHIYQKLGVHHKDELLELVDRHASQVV